MNIFRFKQGSILICGFLLTVLLACETKKSSETTDSTGSIGAKVGTTESNDINQDNKLVALILNSNKGEREANIGQSLVALKASETLTATDSTSNSLVYSQYFNDSDEEFVDIQYYHNGEKVTALNMDVYLNKEADVAILYKQLSDKFSKKYGNGAAQNKEIVWKLKTGQNLTLKDVSLKLAPGLQITYSKAGENSTIE
jgi:hypothetical protein